MSAAGFLLGREQALRKKCVDGWHRDAAENCPDNETAKNV
jgi:hypothetical protein